MPTFPPPLDGLTAEDATVLERYVTACDFPAGSTIFTVGSEGDACYVIDAGTVRIDLDRPEYQVQAEIDSDTTLGYIEPGGILGELSLLDKLPRSASAYAHTDVRARRIGAAGVHELTELYPRVGVALLAALGRDAATKLRRTNERLAGVLFAEAPDPVVDEMVTRAAAAQREIESWPEERIDKLLFAMANAIANHAEELARASVAETGLGDVQSKIIKDIACGLGAYSQLVGKPGWGLLSTDTERNVTDIASPVGVVFGIGPVTNPVSTFIFKAIICVKSRNALIYSPNRRAQKVVDQAGDLLAAALREHGAPVDLVQWVRSRVSRKQTEDFMRHPGVSFILATGGPSMVKAAYSSGTPAIGVGPANTPVLVCSDADLPTVAKNLVTSKTFDNGLLCGAEHNVVVLGDVVDDFCRQLEEEGAAVLRPEEIARFTERMVRRDGRLTGTIVGQTAEKLAEQSSITRDYPIKLIVVPSHGLTADNPYAREKLVPVLGLFTVDSVEEGTRACRELLELEGPGHTAVIYTEDLSVSEAFGLAMPASRILVNTPAVHGMLGFTTGLNISTTLGCGTFGGTSTTDNVSYHNLRNVKRLAYVLPEASKIWRRFGFM